MDPSDALDMLETMLSVDEIAGIEVYRGPSQIPACFNSTNVNWCGAVIVVWTRDGPG